MSFRVGKIQSGPVQILTVGSVSRVARLGRGTPGAKNRGTKMRKQLFSGPFQASPNGFVGPHAVSYCAAGNQASVMTTALILFIPSLLQALQRFSPSRIRNESCAKQMWIGSWSPRLFIARPISSMHSAAQTIRRFGLIFLISISRMSSPIDFPLWLVKTRRLCAEL